MHTMALGINRIPFQMWFSTQDERISNAWPLLKLRLHTSTLCKAKSFSTTILLSTAVCSCCKSTKLRSYTVRTDFWSMLEFWKEWWQLKNKKKPHTLTGHFSDQVDQTAPNQLCCGIQRAADCETGIRAHHQGQRGKGKSGNVLTRLQKAGDSLISTAPFVWDGLIEAFFRVKRLNKSLD